MAAAPISNSEKLAELEGKLAAAEEALAKWSKRVEEAIESGDEKKEEYKGERAFTLERVRELEKQISELRVLAPQSRRDDPNTTASPAIDRSLKRTRVLVSGTDVSASLPKFFKQAIPMASGALQKVTSLDPNSDLRELVIELGAAIDSDPKNASSVIVRPCYMRCFKEVLRLLDTGENVLIGGAPGIGKSVFGLLLAIKLIHDEHRVVLYRHFNIPVLLASPTCSAQSRAAVRNILRDRDCDPEQFDPTTASVFSVEDDAVFRALSINEEVVYIQDAGDSEDAIVRIPGKTLILITSPNTTKIKRAYHADAFKSIFLPPWSLEELHIANQLCFKRDLTSEQVVARFEKFGGIARSIFDIRGKADARYERAIIDCSLAALGDTFRSSYENLQKGSISSMLVHAVPLSEEEVNVSKNQFASPLTRGRLMEKFLDSSGLAASDLARAVMDVPDLAEFAGRYLERNFHRKIVQGGKYKMRVLDSSLAGDFVEIEFPILRVQPPFSRRDFEDIASAECNGYFRPRPQNFPTLDSFALLPVSVFLRKERESTGSSAASRQAHRNPGLVLVIFQVTKSKDHSLNGSVVKRLQKLLAKLGVTLHKTLFVWVSSPDGILTAQPVQSDAGTEFSRDGPVMEQWLLSFGDEYNDLMAHVLGLK